MRLQRLSSMASMATLLFLLFGFGTEAVGLQRHWIGDRSAAWDVAGNWLPTGVPTSSDDVYFDNTGYNDAVLSADATVASLTIGAGINASLTTNGMLTVTGSTTLLGSATFTVGGSAPVDLQLNGTVTLNAGASEAAPTKIDGTCLINLGSGSSLIMGDLQYTYFDEFVETHFFNSNPISSSVRFKGDLHLETLINLDPTQNNIWLDTDADLIVPAKSGNLVKSTTHMTGDFGLVVKRIDYWCSLQGNPAVWTGISGVQPFTWLFGAIRNNQTDVPSDISIVVNKAWPLTGWSTSATEPFAGVGVRIVDLPHPQNHQLDPVDRYWVVQPFGLEQDHYEGPSDPDNNNICITAEYFPNDASTPADARLARYTDNYSDNDGSPVGIWLQDGVISGANGSGRLFTELCPTSGFGDVTIEDGKDPYPLPVELSSFSARVIDNTVKLSWETATEVNNFGFYVERSGDGENWKEVGFVLGSGTSYSPKNYIYIDELGDDLTRLPQLAYRLRQMDRDGTTDYSNIVFVRTGELPEGIELYAAYPNPFNPSTTISFAISQPAGVTLKVYNALGQVVATLLTGMEMEAGLHTVPFSGEALPSGIYMAVLEAGGAVQHQKLVLNK